MITSELHKGICLAICLSFAITVVTNFAFASETSSGRWVIWSQKPAKEWEHGLVTGNGRHGARVVGMTNNERIIINHEELFVRFWDRKKEMVADVAHLLPEVRRLIDDGKEREAYTLANDEATKQLIEKGRAFRKAIIPHPAFGFHIEHHSPEIPTDYRQQLDMETGEVLVRWKNAGGGVEQRVFSSRPHNVNVIQLKRIDGRKLDVILYLKETPGRNRSIEGVQRKDFLKSVKTKAIPGWLVYDAIMAACGD